MDQGSQVDLKNITVPEVHIQAATPEIPEDENQTFNDSLDSEPLELDSDTKNGSAKPSHPLQSNASQQVPTPKGSPTRQSLQQSPAANHSSANQPLRQAPASGESSAEQVPVPVAPSSRRPSQQGAGEANEQPSDQPGEGDRNGGTPDQTLLKRLFIVAGLLYRGFLGFMEPFYSSFKIAHPMLATFLVYFEDVYNSWLDFICTYDSIWDIKLSDILKKLGCSMSRAVKSLPVTMRKTLKTVHKSFCYSREEVRETLCMWETLFAILLPPKEGEVPLFTITEAERSGDKFLQLYFKLTANAAKRLSNRFLNYVASLIPFFKKPSDTYLSAAIEELEMENLNVRRPSPVQ